MIKVALHDESGLQHVFDAQTDDRVKALKEAWRQYRGIPFDGQMPPPWTVAHALIAPRHLGTYDRVYGGNPELVHIRDGQRRAMGESVAQYLDLQMRQRAELDPTGKALCPGCYMIALYDAAVTLAQENGQSMSELGHSMAHLFTQLAQDAVLLTEEIHVMVDPKEPTNLNWLVNQPPADGKDHEEPRNEHIAPLLGLDAA